MLFAVLPECCTSGLSPLRYFLGRTEVRQHQTGILGTQYCSQYLLTLEKRGERVVPCFSRFFGWPLYKLYISYACIVGSHFLLRQVTLWRVRVTRQHRINRPPPSVRAKLGVTKCLFDAKDVMGAKNKQRRPRGHFFSLAKRSGVCERNPCGIHHTFFFPSKSNLLDAQPTRRHSGKAASQAGGKKSVRRCFPDRTKARKKAALHRAAVDVCASCFRCPPARVAVANSRWAGGWCMGKGCKVNAAASSIQRAPVTGILAEWMAMTSFFRHCLLSASASCRPGERLRSLFLANNSSC